SGFEVCVFNARTHDLVQKLTQDIVPIFGKGVIQVLFSHDSRWLAVSGPGAVSVLDLGSWNIVHQIEQQFVEAVLFSLDDRRLYTASGSEVLVHLLRPEDLIQQACGRLTRTLSAEEWTADVGAGSPQTPCPAGLLPKPN